jgi:peptide-methionine (S)-S-oxide reductase
MHASLLSRRGVVTMTTKASSPRAVATAAAANGGSSSSGGPSNNAPRPSLLSGAGTVTRAAGLVGSVVCAAGLFSGIFGGGDKGGDKPDGGKYGDILAQARKPQGCQPAPDAPPPGTEYVALASGCFWGSELAAQRTPGVVDTRVGYTQGQDPAPTYDSVCSGYTGHTEGVLVTYSQDADFGAILDEFLANFDPTTKNRQGGDRGTQYRSGIYYYSEAQREVAAKKLAEADEVARAGKGRTRSGRQWEGSSVVVELKPAAPFFIAEAYHQKYLEKGGRFGRGQSAAKGDKTPIRCYG